MEQIFPNSSLVKMKVRNSEAAFSTILKYLQNLQTEQFKDIKFYFIGVNLY